jgi:type I restriction enzyme M protein
MYGAIIGDVAGSYYEILEARARKNKQIRSYMEKTMILDKNIPLFTDKSSCTDDSILTVAIMDAKLNNKDYKETLKEYGLRELELGKDIYNRGRFGKGFVKWITGDYEGDSYGNGCAMRISSIGFLCNSLEEVKEESYKATIPSHNHEESIKCAEAVATSIFLLRNGISKEKLKEYIENNYFKLDYNLDDLRLNYLFTSRAIDSVPQAIYCFLESKDFENAIRTSLSIGGDSDTIAAITGALAEAHYGVPNDLLEEVKPYLRDYMLPVLEKYYDKSKKKVLEVKHDKKN